MRSEERGCAARIMDELSPEVREVMERINGALFKQTQEVPDEREKVEDNPRPRSEDS